VSTNPPTQGQATKTETGRSCPYCRFPLKEKDQITFCGVCESAHHSDCWEENGGCSVVACAGGPQEADASSAPPPTRNAPPPPPRHDPPSTPPPRRETPQSHVPPRVPNQGKKQKVTIEPDPVVSRSRTESTSPLPEPESNPKTRKSTDKPLMLAGVVVLIAAVVGIVLIAQSFSGSNNAPTTKASGSDQNSTSNSAEGNDTGTSSAGTSDGGIPKVDRNGKFPNELNSKMVSDITQLIRSWHEHINAGNFDAAWGDLSSRKQRQIINDRTGTGTTGRYPNGRSSWQIGQSSLVGTLDAKYVDVRLVQPSYKDEAVMSIYVSNMPYSGNPSVCSDWRGYTWVRYEGGQWKYEPGFQTTAERNDYWASREAETLGVNCSG